MKRHKRAKKVKETEELKTPVNLPPAVSRLLDLVAQVVRRRREKKSQSPDQSQ